MSDDDEFGYEVSFVFDPPISLTLDYQTGTKRLIDVKHIYKARAAEYIVGWCHEARTDLTFRADRAIRATLPSGEVIAGKELFDYLTARGTPGTPTEVPEDDEFYVDPPVTLTIDYRDGKGRATARKVSINFVRREDGVVTLEGHCHLRDDDRDFRLDRIEHAETSRGKVIDPDNLFAYLEKRRSDDPADDDTPSPHNNGPAPERHDRGEPSPKTFIQKAAETLQGLFALATVAGMIWGYIDAGWPGVGAAAVIAWFIYKFFAMAWR